MNGTISSKTVSIKAIRLQVLDWRKNKIIDLFIFRWKIPSIPEQRYHILKRGLYKKSEGFNKKWMSLMKWSKQI